MKATITLLFLLVFTDNYGMTPPSFKIDRWQTTKGAHVVFYQAHEVPMISINIAFRAGSAYDGPHFGLSALTTALLDKGAGNDDATGLADKLAEVGAQYSSETTRDMILLQFKSLTKEDALRPAINTLRDIINQPLFKQEMFNHEKSQQLIAIAQKQESPNDVANIAFFSKLYKDHPYAHPILGTEKTVKTLTLNQVKAFYKQYFTNQNAVIVLVGDLDENKAHELAEQLTINMPQGIQAPPIPKATPLTEPVTVSINYPSSQTVLLMGQLGIDHANPHYFPLIVGNYSLGGGALVSRLSNEIREKRGLTYGIVSQFIPMPGLGPFLINLSTANNQTNTALTLTKETLTQFLKSGPTEEELVAAKQYMMGSFPLSLASNSSIGMTLLRMTFYHLPDDYLETYTAQIDAVTTKDIKQAFDQLIRPNDMLLVTVGKP